MPTYSLAHMGEHSGYLMHGIFGNLFMLTLWVLAILAIIYLWQKITTEGGEKE